MERLGRVGVHVHGAAAATTVTSCDLLITGGRVIDPANQIDQENCDVAVRTLCSLLLRAAVLSVRFCVVVMLSLRLVRLVGARLLRLHGARGVAP